MDTRQVQQALISIGWKIDADGSYGSQTRAAVLEFQQGFSPYDLLIDGMAGPQTWRALSTSIYFGGACGDGFAFREFASKGNGWIKVHRELVRGLVVYRRRYGPTRIVSGYRDPAHNRKVGGKPNSQHLWSAVDIPGVASLSAVRNLRLFSGLGVKAGKVIHVDLRGIAGPATTPGTRDNPTVWNY